MDRYNQVVNERSQLNWDIEEENFIILDGQRNDDSTLNLTLFNSGSVAAHIVDVWVTHRNGSGNWQRLYGSDFWLNPAESMIKVGKQNVTQLPNGIQYNCINLTQPVTPTVNYTVKLVSERGNTASYLIKYEAEYKGPPLVYVYGSMKIKYEMYNGVSSSNRSDSDSNGWCNVWAPWDIIKSGSLSDSRNDVKVKVNITNLCGHDINLTGGSLTYQGSTKQGNRQEFIGGILPEPIFIQNGETKAIILKLTYNDAQNPPAQEDYPIVYVGLAGFSTDYWPDEDFLSGAVMLDAFLVPTPSTPMP